MKNSDLRRLVVTLFVFFGLSVGLAQSAGSVSLQLVDGSVIKGRVLSQTDDEVTVGGALGVVTLPKDQITSDSLRQLVPAAPIVSSPDSNIQQTGATSQRIDGLIAELGRLRALIEQLDNRIQQLEGRPRVVSVPPTLAAWRQLQKGTPLEEVRRILGEPTRIAWPIWYYPNGAYVNFITIGQKSSIWSWKEPQ